MKDAGMQIVTFQLGTDSYGIDIMKVQEIVDFNGIRNIPHAPEFVEGIYNFRGDIIPIINLHKRFNLMKEDDVQSESLLIMNMTDTLFGIIIDRVLQVATINSNEIQNPPQMLSGIGTEYMQGVIRQEDGYLILIDFDHLFSSDELRQLGHYS